MADAKLEIKVGEISFSGEGTDVWLSQQLDKVLKSIPDLVKLDLPKAKTSENAPKEHEAHNTPPAGKVMGTLAAFLKDKKATSNQARKFLATALWLHDAQDQKRVGTADVTKALNHHNQGKLTNASQCLNSNVSRGTIVKDSKLFYVTEEGRADLDK